MHAEVMGRKKVSAEVALRKGLLREYSRPGAGASSSDALTTAFDWLDRSLASLGSHWSTSMAPSVARLRHRHEDPNLHIVLVGEFSTGKSTLINAVVGAPLMAASVLPTTLAVTEIRQAPAPSITARFRGDATPVAYRHPEVVTDSTLYRAIARYATARPSIEGMLRSLSSDGVIAPLVDSIVVEHPFGALGADLVLYDTPGTNDEERLIQVVEELVDRCADVVAVVLRADLPVSLTTLAHVRRLADRIPTHCLLFIVTHLDVVASDERAKVLRSMRRRVATALGGAPAALHCLSPHTVNRRALGERLNEDEHEWADAFERALEDLRLDVARRRVVLGSDQLSHLVSDLMRDVQRELDNELQALATHRAVVSKTIVVDLDRVQAEVTNRYQHRAHDLDVTFRNGAIQRANARLRSAEEKASSAVQSATAVASLQAALAGPISEVTLNALQELQQELSRLLKEHASALVRVAEKELEEVRSMHNKLTAVAMGTSATRPPIGLSIGEKLTLQIGATSQLVDGLAAQQTRAKKGGMAVGAAVGTVLAPGLGTAIGAVAGRFVGGLFGPSLTTMKTSAAASLAQMHETFRADVVAAIDTAAVQAGHGAHVALTHELANLVGTYREVVRRDEQLQRAELNRIDERQAILARLRREADMHIAEVDHRRRELLAALEWEDLSVEHE
jgi:hypothetical protein